MNYVDFTPNYDTITLAELMNKKFPDLEWAVEGLVPLDAVTIVSGYAGSCKTWILHNMAIAIASGQNFLGKFETSLMPVMVIDEENPERVIQRRMGLMANDFNLPIHFKSLKGFNIQKDGISNLMAECRKWGVKVIIIDSLIRTHQANENDAVEMSQVLKSYRMLSANGFTVIICHHNRKKGSDQSASNQDMRGSSDLLGAIDSHLMVNREEKIVTITQSKNRFEEEIKAFSIELVKSDDKVELRYMGEITKLTWDDYRKLILEVLSENDQIKRKEILELLHLMDIKIGDSTLKKILKSLESEGAIKCEAGLKNAKLYSIADPSGG
ncbi:MAG: AAA family ATPase [Patescibacteria group bacterium]|jgi:RecA-family ATPase|nr:AAA family ATPase [Patescibacteria group bacterium]